jgi:hypothetical protein
MTTPLAVRIGVAGSIAIGAVGLCDQVGILPAIKAAGGDAAKIAPLAFAAGVAALLVAGGELAKSRLLEWARVAEGLRQFLARGGFGLFVAISIFLGHSGLLTGERLFLAPIIEPLDADVSSARSALRVAEKAEADERARIAAQVAELDSKSRAAPRLIERAQASADLNALHAREADLLRPYSAATAGAQSDLEEAQRKRADAPKGFASLEIVLPFGLGSLALIAWLIPIAIEYLTGVVGWIAAPRETKRAILHVDVLELDGAGLELIEDRELLKQLRSKHNSLGQKITHILEPRGRKASIVNTLP